MSLNDQSITLPFTISEPGSYVLTSSLTGATDGLIINSDDVTIDLNGFTLVGGTGSAIRVRPGTTQSGLRVLNGYITGWGIAGVDAGELEVSGGGPPTLLSNVEVRGVTIRDCGVGIRGTNGLSVDECLIEGGNLGVSAGISARVADTTVRSASTGIESARNSLITDCVVRGGGGNGIVAGEGSIVDSCTIQDVSGVGVILGEGATVRNSSISDTGGDGVRVSRRGSVLDNTIIRAATNGVNGIALSGDITGNNSVQGNRIMLDQGSGFSVRFDENNAGNSIAKNVVNSTILATQSRFTLFLYPEGAGPWDNIELPF